MHKVVEVLHALLERRRADVELPQQRRHVADHDRERRRAERHHNDSEDQLRRCPHRDVAVSDRRQRRERDVERDQVLDRRWRLRPPVPVRLQALELRRVLHVARRRVVHDLAAVVQVRPRAVQDVQSASWHDDVDLAGPVDGVALLPLHHAVQHACEQMREHKHENNKLHQPQVARVDGQRVLGLRDQPIPPREPRQSEQLHQARQARQAIETQRLES
mmetsp:Transcript_33546/g.79184  ORF Transcript_33546/g.79184 Transcript_33546/m.79184 type:complete len:218 (-) Transcript_33546:849-1502(-)